jgi:hypothetical protein
VKQLRAAALDYVKKREGSGRKKGKEKRERETFYVCSIGWVSGSPTRYLCAVPVAGIEYMF